MDTCKVENHNLCTGTPSPERRCNRRGGWGTSTERGRGVRTGSVRTYTTMASVTSAGSSVVLITTVDATPGRVPLAPPLSNLASSSARDAARNATHKKSKMCGCGGGGGQQVLYAASLGCGWVVGCVPGGMCCLRQAWVVLWGVCGACVVSGIHMWSTDSAAGGRGACSEWGDSRLLRSIPGYAAPHARTRWGAWGQLMGPGPQRSSFRGS